MKKYLAAFAALLVPLLFTVMVHAQPPKVGELKALAYEYKMISIERNFGVALAVLFFDAQTQKFLMQAGYHICNGIIAEKPYGVVIKNPVADEALLFIDNAPTDGIVDEIIINPDNRPVMMDLPTCV
jgi:hypothetical protein